MREDRHSSPRRTERARIFLGYTAEGVLRGPPEVCGLVVGPPRSGKTSCVIIPNVLLAPAGVVSVSTKRDVLDATWRARAARGRCVVFDPTGALDADDVERVGWSPVGTSRDWPSAARCAEAMVGALHGARGGEHSHWYERASALISALLHAAALDSSSLRDVVRAVHRREPQPAVETLARHESDLALDVLVGILETDAREQSGIWSTAAGVLSAYRTEPALASAELPPIDWEELVAGGTLYVTAPADQQAHAAPLVAGLVRELREHCYARTRRNEAGGDLLLVLDELAHIAPLHDLPALIAEGASQGVLTLASLQDLSQAQHRWGEAASGFLTLFGAKLVLGGIGDSRTLRDLSLLAGEHWVIRRSRTARGAGLVPSTVTTVRERLPRRAPAEIASPRAGEGLAVIGARPYRVRLSITPRRT